MTSHEHAFKIRQRYTAALHQLETTTFSTCIDCGYEIEGATMNRCHQCGGDLIKVGRPGPLAPVADEASDFLAHTFPG